MRGKGRVSDRVEITHDEFFMRISLDISLDAPWRKRLL
jgi:hypothetical protein